MQYKYTIEQLKDAVSASCSYAGVLRKIGLEPHGTNYRTIQKLIKIHNIDSSHFTGKSHGTSRMSEVAKMRLSAKNKLPFYEVFKENSLASQSTIKSRLVKDNLLTYICSKCGINDWQNNPISLHVDHINGINTDHRLENLRFLCPNCHSQTETYCVGNRNKSTYNKKIKNCIDCNKVIQNKSLRCVPCYEKFKSTGIILNKNYCIDCYEDISGSRRERCISCLALASVKRKIIWPDLKDLLEMINNSNYTKVGRDLGVNANSVRKYIQARNKFQDRKLKNMGLKEQKINKRYIDIPHGTKVGYSYHKCRCQNCTEANRIHMRNYRNKRV